MPYSKPLCIDLFCGLGGFSAGAIAEGYECVGFDIERHVYGDQKYPAQLVLQDVLTLHGKQFKDAALIVASPPCQAYSYRAMPWSRAKALPPPDNSLFEACFRIQREAIAAAGHHIPLVVENVRGAQKWVGRANWHFGSFYLWGDVPALMPIAMTRRMKSAISCAPILFSERIASTPEEAHRLHYRLPVEGQNDGGSWFNIGSPGQKETNRNPVHELAGQKTVGYVNKRDGHSHTRHLTNQREHDGIKTDGDSWFSNDKMLGRNGPARYASKSNARKFASAMIAKIPLVLSRHIAAVYKPDVPQERVG